MRCCGILSVVFKTREMYIPPWYWFSSGRQIFGFIVAGKSQIQADSLRGAFVDFTCTTGDSLSSNMVVLLSGGLLTWGALHQK